MVSSLLWVKKHHAPLLDSKKHLYGICGYFSYALMLTSSNGNIFALLAICARNSPATDWWFETLSHPLWHHCHGIQASYTQLALYSVYFLSSGSCALYICQVYFSQPSSWNVPKKRCIREKIAFLSNQAFCMKSLILKTVHFFWCSRFSL